jgi:hypothetical protein
MPEQPVFENASHAVKLLNADEFIKKHRSEIFERLAGAEASVKGMGPEGNVVFVAECLPFVAAIVHVGSTLDKFREARDWVRGKLEHADAVSVLSALTFLYIVDQSS